MLKNLFLALLALGLVACAGLGKDVDPPRVSIENFRSIPGEGSGPRFEIDLRIQNPNAEALDIAGISYEIALQDIELVSGVSNDVPRLEGYSEEVVTLQSGLNMIQLIRFFAELGGGRKTLDKLEYRVSAKIDFKGFMPTQRIEETGVIGETR
jgi:LEA14-like dessication related protein